MTGTKYQLHKGIGKGTGTGKNIKGTSCLTVNSGIESSCLNNTDMKKDILHTETGRINFGIIRQGTTSPTTIRPIPLFLLMVAFFCIPVSSTYAAEESHVPDEPGIQEKGTVMASSPELPHKALKNRAKATRVRHGVMVTANCFKGFVKDARIIKSAPDVEIISEKGITCEKDECKAWQVEARRRNEELFDLEVRLQCSSEDVQPKEWELR